MGWDVRSRVTCVFMPSLGARPIGGIPRNHPLMQIIGGDRFIPLRSAMDFDVAHYLLTERKKPKENTAYLKILADTLMPSRHRIFAFRSKPTELNGGIFREVLYDDSASYHSEAKKQQRRQIPPSAEMIIDAPELADDYYLNLLDWGCNNVLSIALGNRVYLWSASSGASELMTVAEDNGPVTSVSWAPNGQHIAIGLNSSDIQLWDTTSKQLLRTFRGVHQARVGSLAWNDSILTTGGMDGLIVDNDVNVRSHIVQTYQGHREEVCSLKWSGSGRLLASGGNDNLLHIWDRSMASSLARPNRNPFLHRFEDQTAAVKALAWCPFKNNLLTSGGGEAGRSIKFWNTNNGTCLNSVDTGSQVCALLWSRNEKELLSSHGFHQNQLILWKYPSMIKIAELMGHTSQVLFLAQSSDGCTVASAAGGIDETLRFWNVFGTPEVQKPAVKGQ